MHYNLITLTKRPYQEARISKGHRFFLPQFATISMSHLQNHWHRAHHQD